MNAEDRGQHAAQPRFASPSHWRPSKILIIGSGLPTDTLGIALALGSAVIWALYWLFNLRDQREVIDKLVLSFFFGSLYAVLTVVIFSSFSLPSWRGFAGISYVGLFEMGLPFILWLWALKRSASPALMGNFVYLAPFVSLVLLHFVLGEPLFVTTFLGLGLIISGILLHRVHLNKLP